jgi:HPt (histidine-containing phosphotransfer) domain-containing protein
VTLLLCLCACLLAALAYLAYRAWLQAQKIQRLARERLRLETELALLTRELHESNRALDEAVRRIDELLAGRHAEESTAADVIDVTDPMGAACEREESEAAPPQAPPDVPIWSDIDTAAVGRLCNLRGSGPSDLYGRLVELFESGSARALVELRTALERGHFEGAATISRKFASSAANVGALTYAQSVRELERLCLAGDAGHALGLYRRLRTAHPALMTILQGRRLKAGGSSTKSAENVGYPSTP